MSGKGRGKAAGTAVATTESLPPRPDWLDERTPWTKDLAAMVGRPPWSEAEDYAFWLLMGTIVEKQDQAAKARETAKEGGAQCPLTACGSS